MSRTSLSIASIIALITSVLQFLPQVMQIIAQIQPLLDVFKNLFAQNPGAVSVAGTALGVLGYQGYAAYRDRSSARSDLAANNARLAAAIPVLAAMGGTHAKEAIDCITEALTENARAGQEAMAREREQAKTDTTSLKEELAAVKEKIAGIASDVQTIRGK